MKELREYITIEESRRSNLRPTHKEELKALIEQRIEEQGLNCDLNDIDVSKVTDMSKLFSYSEFNGDISKWDVSRVKNMISMFYDSKFTGDISEWDVSNVKRMHNMFKDSPLEGKEPSWYRG